MRTANTLLAALSALLMVGCDPGIPAEELDSELRSAYLAGPITLGCEEMRGEDDGSWAAIAHPDDPTLVIVEQNGAPICVDTREQVTRHTAALGMHISLPEPVMAEGDPGPGPVATSEAQPGLDEHSSGVEDDPVPLGKGDRAQNSNPAQ